MATPSLLRTAALLGLLALGPGFTASIQASSSDRTARSCAPGAVRSLVSPARSHAVDARGLVRVYRKPGGRAFARFGGLNSNGVPTVFAGLEAVMGKRCRAAWYRVYVPVKPNGTTGFVRARSVNLRVVRSRIVIDLSARRLAVYDRGRVAFATTTGTAALDKYLYNGKRWQTPWYLYSWNKVDYESDGVTPKLQRELRSTFTDPRLRQNNETSLNITLTGMANYDRTFGDHSVSVMAGVQKETLNTQTFFAFRRNFISTAVDQLFAGGDAGRDLGGGEFNRARLGYFGRVGYNYKEKYLAEFLWRYDGSYIFPEDSRFGFFPGVMAGWRVSEEDFFVSNVPWIQNLKLRASWGQVGAEPYIGGNLAEFQYLSTYDFTTYVMGGTVVRGLNERVLPNPFFTWEIQTSTNFGIELTTLRNRLTFEFDYFINKRDDALFTPEGVIPGSAGISNILPPVNYAKLSNRGWEFTVGYTGNFGELKYNVSVNGGYAKNRIDKWNEVANVLEWQKSTGRSFGSNGASYLLFEYDGVYATQKDIDDDPTDYSAIGGANQRPGDMKFKDINKDGRISAEDQVRLNKTRDPRFTGGLNIQLQYRAFDLTLLFQGASGGALIVRTESGDIGNYLEHDFHNRWTIDNPSSVYPRIASRDNTYYTGGVAGNNTYRLKKTDYVRFKNFELRYNVPASVLRRAGINNLRVYANGINLITWDELGVFDPEAITGNGQYYPQARVLNFGVSLTF